MELANPEFLLLIPLAFAGFYYLRKKRAQRRIPWPHLIHFRSIPQKKAHWVRRSILFLEYLSVMVLILAATGPRSPDMKTRIPTRGIAIMLVLDTSGSMEEQDFPWSDQERISRREAAVRTFRTFVEGGTLPNGKKLAGRATEKGIDQIGLVTFTTWPQTLCPPTTNHAALLRALDQIRLPSRLDTATNIGDALVEGLSRLETIPAPQKVLILLTDGEHNFAQEGVFKPTAAAQLAANLNIPIFVVDTGPDPEAVELVDRENRQMARKINQNIADLTQGYAFVANNGDRLADVYQQIDQLAKQPIVAHAYRRYHEWGSTLALCSFLCLTILVVLQSTLGRQINPT